MSSNVEQLTAAWESLLLTLGGPPATGGSPSPTTLQQAEQTTPVTVLSGFLGAGKTTLLCRLLESSHSEVLAIVNDVASVNVDAALVRSRSAETIELENGCACCVLGDNLRDALTEIGSRRHLPDAIVIEASGVSDPVGIAATVTNVASMTLDGIVTVVDADSLIERACDPVTAPLFERQLEAAHLVALTRTAECSNVETHLEALGRMAPGRPVLLPDAISSSDEDPIAEVLLGAVTRGARPAPKTSNHTYDGFVAETIEHEHPVEASRFFDLLDTLPDSVYRMKGWVHLREGEPSSELARRFEVQAAGRHWRVTPAQEAVDLSQLVVIGRSGDAAFNNLTQALRDLDSASQHYSPGAVDSGE